MELNVAEQVAQTNMATTSSDDETIEEGEQEKVKKPRSSRRHKGKRGTTHHHSPHLSNSRHSPSRGTSPSRISKREQHEKDRDAKRRARGNRSGEAGVYTPGAIAVAGGETAQSSKGRSRSRGTSSSRTNKIPSCSPSRSSRRDQDEKDRDAKRKARSSSRDSLDRSERRRGQDEKARRRARSKAVVPGAVSSTGEHRSRHKTSSPRRHKSLDGSYRSSSSIDGSHRSSRSTNSPRRAHKRDKDSKAKERNRGASRAVTPGAVSSTSSTKEDRKSARHTTHTRNSPKNTDDQDKRAKRRARAGRPASAPGAMSAGPEELASKAKSGNHSGVDDLFDENNITVVGNNTSGLNAGGEYEVVAERIEEEDEEAKMEKLMNARRQAQQGNGNGGGDMDNMASVNQENKAQGLASKRICILLTGFLLIGGIVVGVLFGVGVLGQNDEPVVEATDSPTLMATNAPITPAPSTNMPSSSPTNLVFDRPSKDDCILIRNGKQVENTNYQLEDRNYALSLKVDMNEATEDPNDFFEPLKTQIQSNIMTKLAGCEFRARRRLGSSHDELKFWIRNGLVITLVDEGICETSDGAVSCFKVGMEFTIYVVDDGESRNRYLVERIAKAFDGNLVAALELGAPFNAVEADIPRRLDPTEQPSPSPSLLPSKVPSMAPTETDSSRPSPAPQTYPTTPAPTRAPTLAPTTPEPTPVPTTPVPTKAPTPPPTPLPTAAPAPGVTPRPTIAPSQTPSAIPSVIPSAIPSTLPSEFPSSVPSSVPSSEPTSGPTSGPTPRPTPEPTPGPTPNPTLLPSNSPSQSPTQPVPSESPSEKPFDRSTDVPALLASYGVFNLDSTALDWLINTDTWMTEDPDEWVDRYGMVVFYQKAGKSGWLQSDVTHCSWEKVTCTDGRVAELNLRNAGLSSVPTELGYLTQLTRLEFQNDNVAENGEIPSAITQLSNLRNLFMRSSGITKAGSEILGMSSLTSFGMRGQYFGSFPTHLLSMTNLVVLNLKESGIQGTIPNAIGQLTQLTEIDISGAGVQKPFPEGLRDLPDLRRLVAGLNSWSTTLPTWIGELTKLEQLYLAYSSLQGEIPTQIASMTSLTFLTFNMNSLGGTIPPLPPSLLECKMTFNSFTNTANSGPCTV